MLINKAEKLIQLSEVEIKLRKNATNLEGFRTRQEQISQAVAEILPLVSALRAFRQKGLVTFDWTQKVDPTLQFLAITQEKIHQNPEWIIDNKNFNGNTLKSSVKVLTNSLNQQLSQAWTTYLARQMPSTNQEILNLLVRIDAFKSTVQRIRKLDVQIPRQEFPKNCEDFENIDRLIEQLREAWNSLSSNEVPDPVLRFLRAAANQGASITLFTPEVQEWIAQYEIADSLQIRLI